MTPHPAMDHHDQMRLRVAASRARLLYPEPVGELIFRELQSWEEFGYRLGSQRLIMSIVDAVMNTATDRPEAA